MNHSTMINLKYLLICVLLASPGIVEGGNRLDSIPIGESLKVLAHVSRDSVQLRWAPISYEVWKMGLARGYIIDRYIIARDSKFLEQPEVTRLTREPIRVFVEDQWESVVKREEFAVIAAQAIFGETFSAEIAGNDVVAIANRSEENIQRFYSALYVADLSIQVAKAQGLYFSDKYVNLNEKYVYRISIPTEGTLPTGSVFVSEVGVDSFLQPPDNLQLDCRNGIANLKWDRPIVEQYATYVIERSNDLKNFKRVNKQPFVTLTRESDGSNQYEYYTDSLSFYDQFYYRVMGQSIFGEYSAPSEIKGCRNFDETEARIISLNAFNAENNSVALNWECENDEFVKYFFIERASADKGPYEVLNSNDPLDSKSRAYLDLKPVSSNYYRIKTISNHNQSSTSYSTFISLIDSLPPLPPTGLIGKIDEFGNANVQWTDNGEKDLFGFRIYLANNRLEEMAQHTTEPVRQLSYKFATQLRTLNDTLYVAVAAIDNSQNQSQLSKVLALPLPDLLKPTPPVILPTRTDSMGVHVSWIMSSSTDVVAYELYRRTLNNTHWTRIKKIDASFDDTFEAIDEFAPDGESVLYCVVAIDDSGLESSQSGAVQTMFNRPHLKHPVAWMGSEPQGNNKFLLKWKYEVEGLSAFKIYKANDGEALMLYKTLSPKTTHLLDFCSTDNGCSYQILALFFDGSQSELSHKLKLK